MIRRDLYLNKLEMYTGTGAVKLVTGVRRSGKTTLIKMLMEEIRNTGVQEKNLVYMDFEALIYSYFTKESEFRMMLAGLLEGTEGHMYIFLDEMKPVRGWCRVLTEMMTLFDCEFFIIASSRGIFYEGWKEDLRYSYVWINVYPILFSEYYAWVKEKELVNDWTRENETVRAWINENEAVKGWTSENNGEKVNTKQENAAASRTGAATGNEAGVEKEEIKDHPYTEEEIFRQYLETGAMPACLEMTAELRISYLKDLCGSILLRDVVSMGALRDVSHVDKILHYVLVHLGETFSPKMLKDYIKSQGLTISVDTVYSILDAMTQAGLIYRVGRFDIKTEKELETLEKYYVCDLALCRAVLGENELPIEAAMQNALFMDLAARDFKVCIGKSGSSQIDFVGIKGTDRTYINVCAHLEEASDIKKSFNPLVRIKDNYFKMVLGLDPETTVNKGGIMNYSIAKFLSHYSPQSGKVRQ